MDQLFYESFFRDVLQRDCPHPFPSPKNSRLQTPQAASALAPATTSDEDSLSSASETESSTALGPPEDCSPPSQDTHWLLDQSVAGRDVYFLAASCSSENLAKERDGQLHAQCVCYLDRLWHVRHEDNRFTQLPVCYTAERTFAHDIADLSWTDWWNEARDLDSLQEASGSGLAVQQRYREGALCVTRVLDARTGALLMAEVTDDGSRTGEGALLRCVLQQQTQHVEEHGSPCARMHELWQRALNQHCFALQPRPAKRWTRTTCWYAPGDHTRLNVCRVEIDEETGYHKRHFTEAGFLRFCVVTVRARGLLEGALIYRQVLRDTGHTFPEVRTQTWCPRTGAPLTDEWGMYLEGVDCWGAEPLYHARAPCAPLCTPGHERHSRDENVAPQVRLHPRESHLLEVRFLGARLELDLSAEAQELRARAAADGDEMECLWPQLRRYLGCPHSCAESDSRRTSVQGADASLVRFDAESAGEPFPWNESNDELLETLHLQQVRRCRGFGSCAQLNVLEERLMAPWSAPETVAAYKRFFLHKGCFRLPSPCSPCAPHDTEARCVAWCVPEKTARALMQRMERFTFISASFQTGSWWARVRWGGALAHWFVGTLRLLVCGEGCMRVRGTATRSQLLDLLRGVHRLYRDRHAPDSVLKRLAGWLQNGGAPEERALPRYEPLAFQLRAATAPAASRADRALVYVCQTRLVHRLVVHLCNRTSAGSEDAKSTVQDTRGDSNCDWTVSSSSASSSSQAGAPSPPSSSSSSSDAGGDGQLSVGLVERSRALHREDEVYVAKVAQLKDGRPCLVELLLLPHSRVVAGGFGDKGRASHVRVTRIRPFRFVGGAGRHGLNRVQFLLGDDCAHCPDEEQDRDEAEDEDLDPQARLELLQRPHDAQRWADVLALPCGHKACAACWERHGAAQSHRPATNNNSNDDADTRCIMCNARVERFMTLKPFETAMRAYSCVYRDERVRGKFEYVLNSEIAVPDFHPDPRRLCVPDTPGVYFTVDLRAALDWLSRKRHAPRHDAPAFAPERDWQVPPLEEDAEGKQAEEEREPDATD